MQGLGDTVFQRACLRDFPRLAYVETSWPQLLDDLPNVRCCPPTRDLHLRTQSLNAAREYAWHTPPLGIETLSPMHHSHHPPGVTHLSDVEHSFGLPSGKRVTYDLPDFGMSPLAHERVAVVYLSVVAAAWKLTARAPSPEHISRAAEALIDRGYHVVTVAHLQDQREWSLHRSPVPAHRRFEHGELPIEKLCALIASARVLVCGVGGVLQIGLAYRTPTVVIAGGNGKCDHGSVTVDPRIESDSTSWLYPDEYCFCASWQHDCPKYISDFDAKLGAVLDGFDL